MNKAADKDSAAVLLTAAVIRAEERREGAIEIDVVKRALSLLIGSSNTTDTAAMGAAFDAHMGAECWTDPAYTPDAAMWAAGWNASLIAVAHAKQLTMDK